MNVNTKKENTTKMDAGTQEAFRMRFLGVDVKSFQGKNQMKFNMKQKKHEAIIRYWRIEDRGGYYCLNGMIFKHGNFPDGEPIFTSKLVKIDFVKKRAETQNTIYRLEN